MTHQISSAQWLGAVGGGLLAIALLVGIMYLTSDQRRRKRRHKRTDGEPVGMRTNEQITAILREQAKRQMRGRR